MMVLQFQDYNDNCTYEVILVDIAIRPGKTSKEVTKNYCQFSCCRSAIASNSSNNFTLNFSKMA